MRIYGGGGVFGVVQAQLAEEQAIEPVAAPRRSANSTERCCGGGAQAKQGNTLESFPGSSLSPDAQPGRASLRQLDDLVEAAVTALRSGVQAQFGASADVRAGAGRRSSGAGGTLAAWAGVGAQAHLNAGLNDGKLELSFGASLAYGLGSRYDLGLGGIAEAAGRAFRGIFGRPTPAPARQRKEFPAATSATQSPLQGRDSAGATRQAPRADPEPLRVWPFGSW